MRVVVSADDQRKLVETAKRRTGFTWKKLASILNVSDHTLRCEWLYQINLIPQKTFKELLKLSNLNDVKIIELRPDNWGQQLGAMKANKNRSYAIKPPRKDKKLSELIGIILGDGNISSDRKNGVYCLKIFFDSLKEVKYAKYVESILKDIFKVKPKLRKFKNKNCIYLVVQSKGIVEYLETQGLFSGDKIKNQLTIPRWIWNDDRLLRYCIRGLIDTDGSIYRLTPNWPNLIQIQFKNHNKKLLNDTRRALIRLGFNPSRIHSNRIVMTRQKEIGKYIKEIGTINKNIALSSSG